MLVDPLFRRKGQKLKVMRLLSHLCRSKISINAMKSGIDTVGEIKEFSFGISAKIKSKTNTSNTYNSYIYSSGSTLCSCAFNSQTRQPCKHVFLLGIKYLTSEKFIS
tara:strand:- start:325 stop:645 length:321 start_codon:yes stop_codon:yes gene_type:complete